MIFLLSRGSSELLNLKNQFRLTIDTTRTRLDVYSRKISWSAFSAISLSKGSYSQDSTGEDPSIICSVSQVLLIGSKAAACSGSQLRRFGCMRQTRPNPSKSPKSVSPSSQHGPQAEQWPIACGWTVRTNIPIAVEIFCGQHWRYPFQPPSTLTMEACSSHCSYLLPLLSRLLHAFYTSQRQEAWYCLCVSVILRHHTGISSPKLACLDILRNISSGQLLALS